MAQPKRKKTTQRSESAPQRSASPAFSDRTYQIADLAVKIVGLVPRVAREPGMRGVVFDEGFWNFEFEVARRRAERLLEEIETRQGDIDAYQIFEEGLLLSEEEIAKVFNNAAWSGLSSKVPVTKLMNRLERQFECLESEMLQLLPHNADLLADDVWNTLDDLASRQGIRMLFPEFLKTLNDFIANLRQKRNYCQKEETFGNLIWHNAFLDWCFKKEGTSRRPIKKFRAHEIFRFAASKGWEKEPLVRPLSRLRCSPTPKFRGLRMKAFENFRDGESQSTSPQEEHFQNEGSSPAAEVTAESAELTGNQ